MTSEDDARLSAETPEKTRTWATVGAWFLRRALRA